MKKCPLAIILIISAILSGCDPIVVQTTEEPVQPEALRPVPAPEPAEPTLSAAPKAEVITASQQYILLAEPWKKYFRSSPKLLIVETPSAGIQDLLDQEQQLIKTVLDSSSASGESSEYAELEEKLNELKTIIPAAETASGYVATRSSNYTYVSGGTIYTRTGSYYDGYYYTAFRAKQKSSSPELVRSVQGLVHNASLDTKDLDQRIEALQRLISKWNRRTSELNASGSSGLMREANEAYLSVLRAFTKDFSKLRTEVMKVENEQERILKNKSQVLSEWKAFEDNRLSILSDFLLTNAQDSIEASADGNFTLPTLDSGVKTYLVCAIGDRDLYFEVSTDRKKQHPFVLVDVTPQQ